MADVTLESSWPLIWDDDGLRPVVNVLPDLAAWPTHDPGCCQRGCPAIVNGHDPAGCTLRLTGTCTGCRCSPVRRHG